MAAVRSITTIDAQQTTTSADDTAPRSARRIDLDAALALAREGAAAVAAIRDDDMRPHITRAWGLRARAHGRTLQLCVEAHPGSPLLEHLTVDRELAVTLARPSTYRSAQFKGMITGFGEPTAADLALADAHQAAFAADALKMGVSPALAPRFMNRSALVSLALRVCEAYDQTPGPSAGRAL